ncbi:MAG: hypothetical protein OEM39_05790 [Acidimicrobiia bacterium]|nr:hypothetical protein [Acidimicrobiia bacterium]
MRVEKFTDQNDVVAAAFGISADELRQRVRLAPAREVDSDRLFVLDNALRSDTPGTDGWVGNREWFAAELEEPAAYVAAVDVESAEPIGLVRIWRQPGKPHFGLIGVSRQHRGGGARGGRGGGVAAGLLRHGLEEAAEWGFDTFTADTSPSNTAIYSRMGRLGAESLGQSLQMVWSG